MGRPKKKQTDRYVPTEEEQKSMVWCINNYKKVYPEPIGDEYQLVYEYVEQGKIKKVISPKTYPKHDYASTIWKIYLHEFNKFNKKG